MRDEVNYLAKMTFSLSYRSIFSVCRDLDVLTKQTITLCFDYYINIIRYFDS
jgi:hypothetical protein